MRKIILFVLSYSMALSALGPPAINPNSGIINIIGDNSVLRVVQGVITVVQDTSVQLQIFDLGTAVSDLNTITTAAILITPVDITLTQDEIINSDGLLANLTIQARPDITATTGYSVALTTLIQFLNIDLLSPFFLEYQAFVPLFATNITDIARYDIFTGLIAAKPWYLMPSGLVPSSTWITPNVIEVADPTNKDITSFTFTFHLLPITVTLPTGSYLFTFNPLMSPFPPTNALQNTIALIETQISSIQALIGQARNILTDTNSTHQLTDAEIAVVTANLLRLTNMLADIVTSTLIYFNSLLTNPNLSPDDLATITSAITLISSHSP